MFRPMDNSMISIHPSCMSLDCSLAKPCLIIAQLYTESLSFRDRYLLSAQRRPPHFKAGTKYCKEIPINRNIGYTLFLGVLVTV